MCILYLPRHILTNKYTKLRPFYISSGKENTKNTEYSLYIDDTCNVFVLPTSQYTETSRINKERVLQNFLDNCLKKKKKIVLIRDECHIATNKLEKISDYFHQTINFSATPKDDEYDVVITEDEAVRVNLIKDVEYIESNTTLQEDLNNALNKFKEIKKIYNHSGINPAFIIQISNKNKAEEEKTARKEMGFISVSIGEGVGEIFKGLGVDYLIEGGQTMNPSTEDILSAIQKVNADNIFILPNNGNIILAAEQARELTEDKNIVVIPTKNIPQGITAMINFVEGMTPEENEEAMRQSLSEVKSGQVTYAVRDTLIDGKEIKAGDIMGLSDKTIETVGTDVVETTLALLKKMLEEESEIVTIYYGQEGSEEDARKIAAALAEVDEDLEVEIHFGGQPIYYYFVSVE